MYKISDIHATSRVPFITSTGWCCIVRDLNKQNSTKYNLINREDMTIIWPYINIIEHKDIEYVFVERKIIYSILFFAIHIFAEAVFTVYYVSRDFPL